MKDQYVGDVSDFEKYALLRSLGSGTGLPLAICWMLTPPDDTGEGNRLQYLQQGDRFRHLDPHVFDRLKELVDGGHRNVDAVQRANVFENAVYFGGLLEDHLSSRTVYFRQVVASLTTPALVFLDPDIGLAGPNVTRGRRRSSMYVFDDELRDVYRHGHSIVVFDHWKRVPRLPYLRAAFDRLKAATAAQSAFSVGGRSRVVFLAVPQPEHTSALEHAARAFCARWPGVEFNSDREV